MAYINSMSIDFTSILPWLWLTVLIACFIIEACTMALTTIWAGIAALPMIFIAKTSLPFSWQLIIFALLTVILIVTTRPVVLKKFKIGKNNTNVDALIGEEVLVTKAITKFQKGEAKSKNGVIWSAKGKDDTELSEGSIGIVVAIEGNTMTIQQKI